MKTPIKTLTSANFEQETVQDVPVLVDCWAPWCGPSKLMAPVLDDLASEYVGRVVVAKLNIDDQLQLSRHCNVRGIPAVLIFKNGRLVTTQVGAMNKNELQSFINSNL